MFVSYVAKPFACCCKASVEMQRLGRTPGVENTGVWLSVLVHKVQYGKVALPVLFGE